MTEETRYLVSNTSVTHISTNYDPNTLVGKEHSLPIMLPAGHVVTEVEMQLRNGQLNPVNGYYLYVGVKNPSPSDTYSSLPDNVDFAKFKVDILNQVQHVQCLNNFNLQGDDDDNTRIAFPQNLELRLRCGVQCNPPITGDVYVVVKHKPIAVGPQVNVQSKYLFRPV